MRTSEGGPQNEDLRMRTSECGIDGIIQLRNGIRIFYFVNIDNMHQHNIHVCVHACVRACTHACVDTYICTKTLRFLDNFGAKEVDELYCNLYQKCH